MNIKHKHTLREYTVYGCRGGDVIEEVIYGGEPIQTTPIQFLIWDDKYGWSWAYAEDFVPSYVEARM